MNAEDMLAGTSGIALGVHIVDVMGKAGRKERLSAWDLVDIAVSTALFAYSMWQRQEAKRQRARCW